MHPLKFGSDDIVVTENTEKFLRALEVTNHNNHVLNDITLSKGRHSAAVARQDAERWRFRVAQSQVKSLLYSSLEASTYKQ